MSYISDPSPSQSQTSAEKMILAAKQSGLPIFVVSDETPKALFESVCSVSPRLRESIAANGSILNFDISVLALFWTILETPPGSVAIFVPYRVQDSGARAYAQHIIDPMQQLARPGAFVDGGHMGEADEVIVNALATAQESYTPFF
jgi:hypothetical protein